jgi:NodT family efflux transporter outer membrane factor (OMF) lipoprotein
LGVAAIAGWAAMIGGCVVGPKYHPPGSPPSARSPFISVGGTAATSQPLPANWWRLYRDPILDRLVAQALVENEDLKVAAANLAYAQGLLDEARAGRYPTTDLSAGYGYGRSSLQVTTGKAAGWGYNAGFAAAYQIDLFGRVRRTIESAHANLDASQAAEDAVRVSVAAGTAGAYADICGYAEQLAVARRSLKVVQETYDLILVQRRAGALSDFDVDRQAVLLAQARSAIAPLEGQRRTALFALAAFIGATPAQLPSDAAACATPPRLGRPLPVGDGAALIRRRPDVRQAERSLAAATARIGVAAADYYPTVTFGGMVMNGGPTVGSIFNPGTATFNIGPALTWSFPNILVAKAHVKETTAQAQAALATFDGVVLTALKETEQALSTYGGELNHHADLLAARAAAAAALDLARIQYEAGSLSFLDLLTSEATLVSAETALAASDHSLSTDQVAVFQALGGGWEDAPPVVPPPLPTR